MITDFKIFEGNPYKKGVKLLFVGKGGLKRGEQERVQALYFTVGNIYSVLYRDKCFVKMMDDNGEQCWFFYSKDDNRNTSSYDSIKKWFTFDKSWEEYEYRINHEKFGI